MAEYNPGLEEIANRAADRLAELTQQYIGEGRDCSKCEQYKTWEHFGPDPKGKNLKKSMCKNCKKQYKLDWKRGIKRSKPEPPSTQTCKKCGQEYPLDADHWQQRPTATWGYEMRCKLCRNAIYRIVHQLKKENPKELANGRCYACGQEADELVLDHDHDTNAFRGWACRSCNRRLSAPYSQVNSSSSS